MVPKRENAKSYGPRRSSDWTSATKNAAFLMPASAASFFAESTKLDAQSTPTASPFGPTCFAMSWVQSPKPQPMSSTRAPGG